ncbi:MAG: hypothetical protein HY903_14580 [Deltaproteobacteria bacterium]|nr:hypothetical protein [Deltaproteobacteria bacterium]
MKTVLNAKLLGTIPASGVQPAVGGEVGQTAKAVRLDAPELLSSVTPIVAQRHEVIERLNAGLPPVELSFHTLPQLVALSPAALVGLVEDPQLSVAGQICLSDMLAARAAELSLEKLPKLLRAAFAARDTTVRENLLDAVLVITNCAPKSLLTRHEKALQGIERQAGGAEPSITARLTLIRSLAGANAESGSCVATRVRTTDRVRPLSPAEVEERMATVAVDAEAVVQAKLRSPWAAVAEPTISFLDKGALCTAKPGVLVTDTGNDLVPGILDHHQLAERTCATALVLNRAELIARAHAEAPIHELVTHTRPDLDAAASIYLAKQILATGKVPPGATALAAYVSKDDTARLLVDDRRVTESLAWLAKMAVPLAKKRIPDRPGDPAALTAERDREAMRILFGLLDYLQARNVAPEDPTLFSELARVPAAVLPEATRRDVAELQALIGAELAKVDQTLSAATYGTALVPRLDGAGYTRLRMAISGAEGGKLVDEILRSREKVGLGITAGKDWMFVGLHPMVGGSVRAIGAALEAVERAKARTLGVDRLPRPDANGALRVQPGYNVRNTWYIGGSDAFVVTPQGSTLSGAERTRVLYETTQFAPVAERGK